MYVRSSFKARVLAMSADKGLDKYVVMDKALEAWEREAKNGGT
jgi:hypothetical protein